MKGVWAVQEATGALSGAIGRKKMAVVLGSGTSKCGRCNKLQDMEGVLGGANSH